MKAIKLNYNVIKNGFQFSMLLLIMLAAAYYLRAGITIFSIVIGAALLVTFFWGINKILGLTIFNREGEWVQALPIGHRTAVAAKAITGALWLSLLLTVIVTSAEMHIYAEDFTVYTSIGFLHKIALKLMSTGINEYFTAFVIALIPAILFMVSCIFCLGIITIQILIHSVRNRKLEASGTTVVTFLSSLFLTAVIIGGMAGVDKILSVRTHGGLVVFGVILLMSALIMVLTVFCARELDTRYDLK